MLYSMVQHGKHVFAVILQNSDGHTAIQDACIHKRHIPAAIMLAAGANPTLCSDGTVCPLHHAAIHGSVA